jgi:TetR/AcrR family transcriptional regulator, tetracycline repressor protein
MCTRMFTPATPRRRGPRRALTEEKILDTALRLLDQGGPGAASIRRIAAQVGVAPNAIYTYFPDKAAVLRAVAERLLDGVDHDVFADREQHWRVRVESLALELRATLTAHPGAVGLLVTGPLDGPSAMGLNERLLQLFADARLGPAGAAQASYLLMGYVFGSVSREVAEMHEGGPLPPQPERAAARRADSAAMPADRFPLSTAADVTMARHTSTEQFVWGLDRILDGLSAWAGTSRHDPPGDTQTVPPQRR